MSKRSARAWLQAANDKVRLHGDETKHEQTDHWSNRDLIPLPPSRRTWGKHPRKEFYTKIIRHANSFSDWFNYFGFWTLSSLNITNWQTPNTFLAMGLSVGESMAVIIVGNALIVLFATLIAYCGIKWHIGFTVQNRFTWGLRGSYIPLLQRIMLNFIWTAVQCWNAGRLVAVCLTAIWPSYATMPNTLSSSMPTTLSEFVGFIIFWVISIPFLFIRPENFRWPFLVTSIYCALGMIAMMIWSLSVAKGVGPLWTTGESILSSSPWNSSWLMCSGINQMIGGIAAGLTNGSDFSRYSKSAGHYVTGTVLSGWLTGIIISFMGLVTTAACQKLYGQVYWNPPDLLLVMMDNGNGSSAARAGVFFLAFGFALTLMFENVCGNAVAGGIDLAGLFPRYIDIRRGAIITFVACWVVQPWQLVNRATTFIEVLSSFSVFLAPIMGMMACDFYLLRHTKVKLSDLYRKQDSLYWYFHGVNWRAIPAWLCGWAPTIGGLIVTVRGDEDPPQALVKLYYMAFLLGFFISGTIFYILNLLFPVQGLGVYDEIDVFGSFSPKEAAKLGVSPADIDGYDAVEPYLTEEILEKKK